MTRIHALHVTRWIHSSRRMGRFYTQATAKVKSHATPLDGLIVGCYAGKTPSLEHFSATACNVNALTNHTLFEQTVTSQFRGKRGDVRILYPTLNAATSAEGDEAGETVPLPPRIALVGLGPRPLKSTGTEVVQRMELVRMASATGVRALLGMGAKRIGVEQELGGTQPLHNVDQAIAEGAELAAYTFDHLKTQVKDAHATTPLTVHLCDRHLRLVDNPSRAFEQGKVYAQSQNLARHLMETPGNLMTPRIFAEAALREFAELKNVTLHVRDEAWVLGRNMHAFHAVAKGSTEPLQYVEVHYAGRGPFTEPDVVMVGKGVTFDSGGISIKPAQGMGLMKGDMGGAATVLSALHGLVRLKEKLNVVALIPLCENMPSGKATKPGDVIRASNGITVEIDNTDAEGRLILADALYHGTSLRPKVILDVATLTGAVDVALGRHYTGVFCSSSKLWELWQQASHASGDHAWRLPLDARYLTQMESTVADLKNSGDRSAGSCTAAAFLTQFLVSSQDAVRAKAEGQFPFQALPDVPHYTHLDMAGTMHYNAVEHGYNCKGMSGRPTRLLMTFLQSFAHQLSQQEN